MADARRRKEGGRRRPKQQRILRPKGSAGPAAKDPRGGGVSRGSWSMRILMQARVSLFTVPGGDTVQVVETMRALRRMGADADVSVEPNADPRGYDIVHLFNLGRVQETARYARRAARAHVPMVLSPIYWDTSEFERRGHSGARGALCRALPLELIERLRGVWRYCVDGERNQATFDLVIRGWRRLQRDTLSVASCLLPNSATESALLRRSFGPLGCPTVVVPNGVNPEFGSRTDRERRGVACVGRIEPRKNQLGLVRALRGTTYGLSLVGAPAPNHRRYLSRTLRCGGAGVRWLRGMPHEQARQVMSRARVHALPSWFETPGLASLEAAAAGCAVVVSDRGSTREYFGDDAQYCDPADLDSIRGAVARAWAAPPAQLRERVLDNFTWAKAAERTLYAYHLALDAGSPCAEAMTLPGSCAPASHLTGVGATLGL